MPGSGSESYSTVGFPLVTRLQLYSPAGCQLQMNEATSPSGTSTSRKRDWCVTKSEVFDFQNLSYQASEAYLKINGSRSGWHINLLEEVFNLVATTLPMRGKKNELCILATSDEKWKWKTSSVRQHRRQAQGWSVNFFPFESNPPPTFRSCRLKWICLHLLEWNKQSLGKIQTIFWNNGMSF